jgi:hypothetical protein
MTDEEKKEKQREYQREYHRKNKKRIKERDAEKYKAADKERIKEVRLARISKLTPEQLEEERKNRNARRSIRRADPVNKQKKKEEAAEYRKNNKEAVSAREKDYKKGRGRPTYWKRQGIILTVEGYDKMLSEQNGCCAICGELRLPDQRVLVVDHNHNTGKIRGLLCHPCNMGIGQLKDSLDVLRKAVLYLEKNDG